MSQISNGIRMVYVNGINQPKNEESHPYVVYLETLKKYIRFDIIYVKCTFLFSLSLLQLDSCGPITLFLNAL